MIVFGPRRFRICGVEAVWALGVYGSGLRGLGFEGLGPMLDPEIPKP